MPNYSQEFKDLLRTYGYSFTKQRAAIFLALQSRGPLSMNELLTFTNTAVDRASLYRTVAIFEKLNIVRRVNVGWKYKVELSDAFTAHHHHLICNKCGRVTDIEDEEHINNFICEITKKFKFKPQRHQFEIEGYCSICQLKT